MLSSGIVPCRCGSTDVHWLYDREHGQFRVECDTCKFSIGPYSDAYETCQEEHNRARRDWNALNDNFIILTQREWDELIHILYNMNWGNHEVWRKLDALKALRENGQLVNDVHPREVPDTTGSSS